MSKDLRIVFMGTPDFAVESLKILVENDANIVGVITSVDKPAGRGRKLRQSAVKEYALANDLNILQPGNLKNPEFVEELRSLNADLQIVVAFRMLPEVVWNMPPEGTINLHASLLPQYRGAAPINWAIINGETETGVCTFKLKHEIDTGDLIFSKKVEIFPSENAGELHDKLMKHGAELVLKTVQAIESGKCPSESQPHVEDLKIAPKIFKKDCEVNWDQSNEQVYNFIRGLSPYPTAWTKINHKICKVFLTEMCEYDDEELAPHPGTLLTDNKTFLKFKTNNGYISILSLQMEGKKLMRIDDFLRGTQVVTS